ncbi:FabD/lysophospholipase-like protein [Terfezia boudieri ATCC MYA-4762]|uniref:FabD/lysophospholipase-like protein n=1 Tax=Terfezia boudieri ATCC MYA-4762 TaxID=1051890 RepID=A0A3N4MIL6_9PEZI|nr:FabD/lysophospholipase-like protein [Terfezia boudieri ATCC MYA-4762]
MASTLFHPRARAATKGNAPTQSGANFQTEDNDIDDVVAAQEEAEIIIAYRLSPVQAKLLSPHRPRTSTITKRRDNFLSGSGAPPLPKSTAPPSTSGSTTSTLHAPSTSFPYCSGPGDHDQQDRLSEAARRCQEWVETRSGEVFLPDSCSASAIPQYSGAGTGNIKGSSQKCVPKVNLRDTGENKKVIDATERAWRDMVNNDPQVPIVPQTERRGCPALVFDEAVGGWGKKKLTESSLREPVVMGTAAHPATGEAQNLLPVCSPRPLRPPNRYHDKRRETVTSVITSEDKEEIRLNQLRLEREREKLLEERELRERNKKKPPLRLLSLDGGGIRGYTMILVLEELMHQCFVSIHGRAPDARKGERPSKPCEVFDLIGGTGIGGLIAIFLGRLRLSVTELKDMYPSLMQSILQHDKRMFGVPFRSTLFKASKLVEVLRTTIRQQGNITDSELPKDPFDSDDYDEETTPRWAKGYTTPVSSYAKSPTTPDWPTSAATFCDSTGIIQEYGNHTQRRKSLDDTLKSFSDGSNKGVARKGLFRGGFTKKSLNDLKACSPTVIEATEIPQIPKVGLKYCDATDLSVEGISDEMLYDARAGRCRTFVTAILKGSFYDQEPALLRSYNSPAEALLEPNCAIWQACAATTAVQMLFKPVQIGQHIFHDEGPGSYNPTPSVLKEAAEHLWRGREIGCITSIGTGKLGNGPSLEHAHSADRWEGHSGGVATLTAAKRRLGHKLDACEIIHRELNETTLQQYGVLTDDYFRFNVDLGLATSELSEWDNLAELNTMTKRYLGKVDVHDSLKECGRRLGAIEKIREKMIEAICPKQHSTILNPNYTCGELLHFKAELPADEPVSSVYHPVEHDTEAYAELPTQEVIDRSNREFFPPKLASHNTPAKRETFYIVSELPYFEIPPTSEKGL